MFGSVLRLMSLSLNKVILFVLEVKRNMPSEKILEEKKKIVLEMTERLKSQAGVFIDYKGITVNEDTDMRVKMRNANVDYSVIKNRLMKLAIKNVGFDELDSILVGTTSLAISNEDPIAPARIIKEHADKFPNYFEIKAGFMDGKVLSADEVNSIASIPALPVLQAQFLGTLLAPITSLAVVLKAAAEKGGAPADVEVKAESPAEEVKAEEAAPAEESKPEEEKAEETAPAEEVKAEETKAEEAAAPAEEVKAEEKKAEEAAPAEEAKPEETKADAGEKPTKKPAAKKAAAPKPAKEETPEEK